MSTNNGLKGGLVGGKTHDEGGVQAIIVDDNKRPVEIELGEVIITSEAVKNPSKKTYTGTNKEILSKINQSGGGVPIYAQGGEIKNERKEIYTEWKSLVNMPLNELKDFYNSKEGKEAGLSSKEANDLGIDYGRESARWIMKMKKIPYNEWSNKSWEWAKKQISFIKRMKGVKGNLYDKEGNKTRKHLSLLIWGHNPEKYNNGGELLQGGLADGNSVCDISIKHDVTVDYAIQQFDKGVEIEKEHTSDYRIAQEIALDHLYEDIEYYNKLAKIESSKNTNNNKKMIHNLSKEILGSKYIDVGTKVKDEQSGLTYKVSDVNQNGLTLKECKSFGECAELTVPFDEFENKFLSKEISIQGYSNDNKDHAIILHTVIRHLKSSFEYGGIIKSFEEKEKTIENAKKKRKRLAKVMEVEEFSEKKEHDKGGLIVNQYKDKEKSNIWASWNKKQREHFILDHVGEIENISPIGIRDYADNDYKELPKEIKSVYEKHIQEGQYAKGGKIKRKYNKRKK